MASYDEQQATALTTTVAWLEDEVRDTRALLARQQQAIDQLAGQLADLTSALHGAEDTLAALLPRLTTLPDLDARLLDLRDELARQHEQTLGVEARLADLGRLRQTETERDRVALNDLSRRLESVERGAQGNQPRFEALDETARRALDLVGGLRQRMDEIERAAEGLETRLARIVDGGGRTEHQFARLSGALDALRQQDLTLAERMQVYAEIVKRIEAQLSLVADESSVGREALERIDLNRLEVHRLEERIAAQEALAHDLRERDDDAARQLAILDGRDRGLADRLGGFQTELAAHRAQVVEQFGRLHQAQERLKRRQIEDLEREIRELRIHAFKTVDE